MAGIERRYSKEEIARRGDEIYESKVRPQLKKKDDGRIVALDIETGEWEISDDVLDASHRLHARVPDSQTWIVRVGSRYVHRFGWSEPPKEGK
jgi:hypothetical protein